MSTRRVGSMDDRSNPAMTNARRSGHVDTLLVVITPPNTPPEGSLSLD